MCCMPDSTTGGLKAASDLNGTGVTKRLKWLLDMKPGSSVRVIKAFNSCVISCCAGWFLWTWHMLESLGTRKLVWGIASIISAGREVCEELHLLMINVGLSLLCAVSSLHSWSWVIWESKRSKKEGARQWAAFFHSLCLKPPWLPFTVDSKL